MNGTCRKMKSHEIMLRLHAEVGTDANQDWLEDCELSEILEAIILVDMAIEMKASENL
jgi:hypothetical protein